MHGGSNSSPSRVEVFPGFLVGFGCALLSLALVFPSFVCLVMMAAGGSTDTFGSGPALYAPILIGILLIPSLVAVALIRVVRTLRRRALSERLRMVERAFWWAVPCFLLISLLAGQVSDPPNG